MKHKERKRACVPLPSIATLKFLTFRSTTALQLCKLISVQGWIERLERNRRLHHSHQFLNYVLSFLKKVHTSLKRTALIILLLLTKNNTAQKWKIREAHFCLEMPIKAYQCDAFCRIARIRRTLMRERPRRCRAKVRYGSPSRHGISLPHSIQEV